MLTTHSYVKPELRISEAICLHDMDKRNFYVHESVHREPTLKYSNKMTLFVQYIILCKRLYIFRVKHSPIIRSSNKLYLQHLVVTDSMRPAVAVGESESRDLVGSNSAGYSGGHVFEFRFGYPGQGLFVFCSALLGNCNSLFSISSSHSMPRRPQHNGRQS
jgi:hypothetical protein